MTSMVGVQEACNQCMSVVTFSDSKHLPQENVRQVDHGAHVASIVHVKSVGRAVEVKCV
jgi:hypothetical protein